MKNLIIFLFFTFSFQIVHSQSFSLTELMNMTKMDIDNFDTYVLNKGFKFLEIKKDEYREGSSYALNQSSFSKYATKFISLYYRYFGDTNKCVSYQTSNTNEYLKIKNQIRELGFKLIKTEVYEGSNFFDYSKGKYIVTLTSFQAKNVSDVISTYYEISVKYMNE